MKNLLEYNEALYNEVLHDVESLNDNDLGDYKAFTEKYKDFVDCYREKMKFKAIQESVITEEAKKKKSKEYDEKIIAMTEDEFNDYAEKSKTDGVIEMLIMCTVNTYRQAIGLKALSRNYYGE